MPLCALIFDVDGTLAETERAGHRVAFNAAFAAVGLPWHWDEQRYDELLRVFGGKERMVRFAEDNDPGFLAQPGAGQVIAAIHADKTRRYGELIASGAVPLRPGVETVLRDARAAGITLAIATTTAPANVTALLTATLGPGAVEWFSAIGAGDVVPAKKPAPDIYEWVLEQLEVPAADCLAIEDAYAGLMSARAAGIPTLITPSEHGRHDDFSRAIAVLPDLSGVTVSMLRELHDSSSITTN